MAGVLKAGAGMGHMPGRLVGLARPQFQAAPVGLSLPAPLAAPAPDLHRVATAATSPLADPFRV